MGLRYLTELGVHHHDVVRAVQPVLCCAVLYCVVLCCAVQHINNFFELLTDLGGYC